MFDDHDIIREDKHAGLTIQLVPDHDPMSPREWSNLGVMLCSHRSYNLGDEEIHPGNYESEDELVRELREERGATVVLPLYLLDHSGITIRAGDELTTRADAFACDPGGWDTSMVGFIIDTPETRAESGIEAGDPKIVEYLKGEVETYARYLEGAVYGYAVVDPDTDEVLDSCFGYFDEEDALTDARSMAEHERAEIENAYYLRTIRVEDGAVVCPTCEARDRVHESHTVLQTNALQVEHDPEGRPYIEEGDTETAWDATAHLGYGCDACGATDLVLPDSLTP